MSTEHTILARGAVVSPAFEGATPHARERVTITLDERGGAFDLRVDSPSLARQLLIGAGETYEVARALSCADLRQIRDRIDEVLSYFDEEKAPPSSG